MRRKFINIFFALCLIVLISAKLIFADNKEDAEKLYNEALTCLQNKDTTAAIALLKESIRKNRKLAKAHNQLAVIYMNEGTVYGRFKATFEIEKAIRYDPENLKYRYNQALLNLKKGMINVAENQFKKILEKDPDNYLCYLHLASIKESEMLHYQNMIDLPPNSDGVIYFQEFADKLLDETAEYYRKAIALKPDSTEPYYCLAMIFYEFEKYHEMVQLLESAVKINPQDKNCHLFLGLGYYELDKYELAEKEFARARQLMSPEEWAVMESLDTILPDTLGKIYLTMGVNQKKEFAEQFWRKNEPFFLTAANERRLEHYSRVAYANLRFSDAKKNIQGWKTDMGKVYIRYGKPKRRYRTRPSMVGNVPGSRNPLISSKEIWIYSDFEFKFEDEYLSGNYSFMRNEDPRFDYKLLFDQMIKKKPTFYELKPDSSTFPVDFELVNFFSPALAPDPEFCFSIPLDSMRFENILPLGKKLQTGIFIFKSDSNYTPILSGKHELTIDETHFIKIKDVEYFSSHLHEVVPAGEYMLALEFKENFSGKLGRVRQKIQIDSARSDKLELSQVLVAQKIEFTGVNTGNRRDKFTFLPNPVHEFYDDIPVGIYFEVYNLQRDNDGQTHYRVQYQTSPADGGSFLTKAMKFLGLRGKPGTVTTSYEYSSNRETVEHYQYLSFREGQRGRLKLVIKVDDLVSGKSAERQTELIIDSKEK